MTRPAQPYHDRPPLLTLGYLCTPTVMSLSFLPLDVLLVIFRELGVVDVVRIGMVSPLAGLSSQNTFTDVQRPLPSHTGSSRLGRPTREVTSGRTGAQTCHAPNHFLLHARTQKLVTHWMRLRFRWRWDRYQSSLGFAAKSLVGIPGVFHLVLLPGGKLMLVIDNRGCLTLRWIELDDGRVPLPVVAKIKFDERLGLDPGGSKLLTTTSPSPIFIWVQGNKRGLSSLSAPSFTDRTSPTDPAFRY